MRAIELQFTEKLYKITENDIYPVSIQGLALKNDVVHITFDGYTATVKPDATYVQNRYNTAYFFSIEDAQTAQLYRRKDLIEKAFKQMQKSINEYNELIKTWFNQPASEPKDEN